MEKADINHYRRAQLDRALEIFKGRIPPRPKNGWIAEVRTLLHMTTAQLARRIGVSQSVVSNFEKSERENTITLQSLEKIASALECNLQYLFVPKKGLEAELYDRAEKLYRKKQRKIEHHMSLEGQSESEIESARTAYEILKLYKRVWDEK